jgi:hypothetical protein
MARPPLCPELLSVRTASPIDYAWDDWQSQAYFNYADVPELEKLKTLTGKANIALAIAVGEWIEARFEGIGLDPQLSAYLDISWGALLDPSISGWIFLDYPEWEGPFRAPQLITMGIVNEAFFESQDNPEMAWRACYALNLARYVLPDTAVFNAWYDAVFQRLVTHHSWTSENEPEPDIFAESYWQGAVVAREAFDLARPYDPTEADQLL